MNNFKKLAEGLPTAPLLAAIDAHPEWWDEMTLRQDYPGSAHAATQSIILRGTRCRGTDLQRIFDDTTTEWWDRAFDVKEPLIDLMHSVMIPIHNYLGRLAMPGRIIVARLPTGAKVAEHTDEGKYAESSMRLHIPLRTNRSCYLASGDEVCHLGEGELWWFNHRIPHSAYNLGDTERIHLILDVMTK